MTATTPAAAPAAAVSISTKPAVPQPLKHTFKLAVPISDGTRSWDAITLVEPTLGHRAKVQRQKTATGSEVFIALIADLAGVPAAAVRRIKARDGKRIRDWLDAIQIAGVLADVIADAGELEPMPLEAALAVLDAAEALGPDAELFTANLFTAERSSATVTRAQAMLDTATPDERLAAARTPFQPALDPDRAFVLQVPVAGAGPAPLTSITVREPDLEAGIAVERSSETAAGATAAMIAALSGQSIPTVMRLAQRDVSRIERWLDFFSSAGEPSPAPTPAEIASPAVPAAGATSA